ncbi:DUF2474 domain-containing protein [Stappia sp. ES.058]|uniref:DUF2474 domain-containing protein n=1 Tax=Stappia sp. ES.058 TaxID=1881061 RepID=UPI00087B3B7B|nr:DUF2474 domain-containing protein [Stappia sp. ES.058]SDU49090.1 hypothetical protein SAMN05428979_4331 [Stappia sp. ES.058]
MARARHTQDRDETDTRHGRTAGLPRRLAWFAALWLAGVGTLFVIASVIRWAIL